MKNKKIIGIVILIIIVAVIIISSQGKDKVNDSDLYKFQGDKFSYSQDRGKPEYNMSFSYKNNSVDVYAIDFKSRNFTNYKTQVYGLLFMPSGKTNLPGIVLLPGGGGTKEQEAKLASLIANEGYAVLTIDQRGIGQTGGYYLSLKQDYEFFSKGIEPVQHLSVFDALRSFDVLSEIKQIDKNNIAIAGESMGGRYAMIAASMDNRVKGALVISSAGFAVEKDNEPQNSYLRSIDPDNYINDISPNYFVMIHSKNDPIIPVELAQNTFGIAGNPKNLYMAESDECSHGYCPEMRDYLMAGLKAIFK